MVIAYPLALTPGTDGRVVERAVFADIRSAADLDKYRGRLQGAVVLATPPMPMGPRMVQDGFRHTEESLSVFETEGPGPAHPQRHATTMPQYLVRILTT